MVSPGRAVPCGVRRDAHVRGGEAEAMGQGGGVQVPSRLILLVSGNGSHGRREHGPDATVGVDAENHRDAGGASREGGRTGLAQVNSAELYFPPRVNLEAEEFGRSP